MDLKKKTIKSLRNIHKETATELKNCPQRLTNEYFYSYMRSNAFKLSNSQLASKPVTPTPASTSLNKHKRAPQSFHRSFSPKKRLTIIKTQSPIQDPKSPIKRLENLENDLTVRQDPEEVSKNENNFNYLCFDKDNKGLVSPEYRKKYDRLFKGKISKNFLKFND